MSHFTCAESSAKERKQQIFLICIRFGSCKMRRLKRALHGEQFHTVRGSHCGRLFGKRQVW